MYCVVTINKIFDHNTLSQWSATFFNAHQITLSIAIEDPLHSGAYPGGGGRGKMDVERREDIFVGLHLISGEKLDVENCGPLLFKFLGTPLAFKTTTTQRINYTTRLQTTK